MVGKMNVTVDRALLLKTLDVADRINGSLALTLNADLEDGGRLWVQLQSESMQITHSIPAQVNTPGSVGVNVRKFHERVRAMESKCALDLINDTEMFHVVQHDAHRRFGMIQRERQEAVAFGAPGEWCEVDADLFADLLRACSFATGDDPSAPTYVGMLRQVTNGQEWGLQLCATDNYRVAWNTMKMVPPRGWPMGIGITSKALDLILFALTGEATVHISLTDRNLFVRTKKGQLGFRTCDCNVPFDQFFALVSSEKFTLRLPVDLLVNALKGLLPATDAGHGVEWRMRSDGQVRLVVTDEKGRDVAEEEVRGEWCGEVFDGVAKLNGKFVVEAATHLRNDFTEHVYARFTEPLRPFVFDAGTLAQCMINPMRIG